jgi:hypothetical protein
VLIPLAKCGADCATIAPLGSFTKAAIAAGMAAAACVTWAALWAMHDGAPLRHALLHWPRRLACAAAASSSSTSATSTASSTPPELAPGPGPPRSRSGGDDSDEPGN